MGYDGFKGLDDEKLLASVRKCYGFGDTMRMELLKYSENLTYRLRDGKTGEKYVLRVFRPGYHRDEELEGELVWIHRLTLDTDIRTADVLPGRDGAFVQSADGFHLALFRFIEGYELTELSRNEWYCYMEKIGEIAAKMHVHAMGWPAAGDLKRFSWDLKDIIGKESRWGHYSHMECLGKEDARCYDDASDIIRFRLNRYRRSADRYGLLHSDLNLHNLLVRGQEIYVLDFDDCGYGWFLYDLATVVMEYFDETLELAIKALLSGYERVRSLSEEEKEELPTFIVARKILRLGWIASHRDNDTVKNIPSSYFEKTALVARKFCSDNADILEKLRDR